MADNVTTYRYNVLHFMLHMLLWISIISSNKEAKLIKGA